MTQVWQIAAGDRGRNYTDLFLRHDVMFMGPGDYGDYNSNKEAYRKSSQVKRIDKGTTRVGYKNRNGQKNLGRTVPPRAGNDYGQYVYIMRCLKCGKNYGANGSDIFQRKCPFHQGGKPGLKLFAGEMSKTI